MHVKSFLTRQLFPPTKPVRTYSVRLADYLSNLNQNAKYENFYDFDIPLFPKNGGTRRKRRKRVSRKYYFLKKVVV